MNILMKPSKNSYIYSVTDSVDISKILATGSSNVYDLPLVFDTEFLPKLYSFRLSEISPRLLVTAQIKSIFEDNKDAYIGIYSDIAERMLEDGFKVRYPVLTSEDTPFIDYLRFRGFKASLFWDEELRKKEVRKVLRKSGYNVLNLVIFSHYSIADLRYMIFSNEENDFLRETALNKGFGNVFECKKRLRTGIKTKNGIIHDFVNVPAILTIDGCKFLLKLKLVDTSALHGYSSLLNLMESVGMDTSFKTLLNKEDKEDIYEVLTKRPDDFHMYAISDLSVYDILVRNHELFSKVSKMLAIPEQTPRLTIGDTVSRQIKSCVLKHFEVKENQIKIVDEVLKASSAKEFKKYIKTTKCLLGKVFGGRCFNNRPTLIRLSSLLIDIDISSCYGYGLRNQDFFLGIPVIEDYDIDLKNNRYKTLREFLKLRKYHTDNSDLVYGNWFAIVDTIKNLEYPQDFLTSWFDFKVEQLENDEDELGLKTGRVKILKYQLINSCINEDFLEWLFNICSPRQRNDLLDKIVIKASMFYPPSTELESVDALVDVIENWKKENTVDLESSKDKSFKTTKVFKLPTYHVKANLGKLMIDDLLTLRNFFKEIYGKKSSLQTVIKLCTNTVNGVLSSQYFNVSNPLISNNITARARALCWYMEKGLYGVQSITDGCVFDPNNVVTPQKNKRVYAEKLIDLHTLKGKYELDRYANISFKPLKSVEKYDVDFDTDELTKIENGSKTVLDRVNGFKFVEVAAMNHLKDLFPNVSVLHKKSTKINLDKKDEKYRVKIENTEKYLTRKEILDLENDKIVTPLAEFEDVIGFFSFEIKDWYEGGSFHGTSNYYLNHRNVDRETFKMRSYEKNSHKSLEMTKEAEVVETFFYDENTPSKEFLVCQLWKNDLKNLDRAKVFYKQTILKPNEYRENHEKYDDVGLFIGDSVVKYGLLRELSLSQFCFNTYEQFKAIDKEYLANKRKFYQSYECYFLDKNTGKLNYEEMILTIEKLIRENCLSINKALDKNMHRKRDLTMCHPQNLVYIDLKAIDEDKENCDNEVKDFNFADAFNDIFG